KDILNLVYLCRHYGLHEAAAYWQQVVDINNWQKQRFVRRMIDAMFNTVSGKRIAVLGLALKKDTNDTRESAAIDVCAALRAEHALLAIYDPKVTPDSIHEELARATGMTRAAVESAVVCCDDVYAATRGAHALAVITEWDEFRTLDFERIY